MTHDARGNLTFDGVKTFAYDAANRLVSASGGGVSAALKYAPARAGFTRSREPRLAPAL